MADLSELKKKIVEQRAPRQGTAPARDEPETVLPAVDRLVENIKKKYAAQGMAFGEEAAVEGKLGVLREGIAGTQALEFQAIPWLLESRHFFDRFLARFYLLCRPVTASIDFVLSSLPQARDTGYFLSSAGLPLTQKQFMVLVSAASFLAGLLALLVSAYFAVPWQAEFQAKALAVILSTLVVFLAAALTFLSLPKALAIKRGEQASGELPFALRQMATQLHTGVGLYKSFQDIAAADYGVLSEEFSRTVNEIEEGAETKDAIERFARRTQSTALRRALLHVNRALRMGGNLSEAMSQIAEDVSFELRMRTRDFSEKMNFFGVIFIVTAVVLPVFIAIITGITHAPIGVGAAVLSPEAMAFAFLVALPVLLLYLIAYLVYSQPKV